jgi:type IV secretion system protein VirB6
MNFTLYTELFQKIDGVTLHFITDMSQKSIAIIAPIVSVGLVLSFIIFGFAIMKGAIDMPIMAFLSKSLRIGIITSIALSSGFYQEKIAKVLNTLPDDLSISLVQDPEFQQNKGAGLIDRSFMHTLRMAGKAFKHAMTIKVGTAIGYIVIGLCVIVFGALLVAIGAAFLLVVKIAMALLAGLGPFFILAILWEPTRHLFERWTQKILNYTLLMVIFSSVFGFMMSIYGSFMAQMDINEFENVVYGLGSCIALSISMLFVMFQIPSLAASLAGGFALGVRQEAATVASMAKKAGNSIPALFNLTKGAIGSVSQGVRSSAGSASNFYRRLRGKARA